MVSVTSRTGGRTQVSASSQSVVMHTFVVLRKLVRGDGVACHVGSVGMAAGAGLRDVERMNLRPRVARWPKTMQAMAVGANRHLGVTLGKKFSMHASLVLSELVRSQRRVVFAHECSIRMATAAEFRNLGPRDLSAKSSFLAHGIDVGLCGISAMATRAGQSFLRMDILRELLFGDLQRRIQGSVTVQASAALRVGRRRKETPEERSQQWSLHCVISPCIHR